MEGEQVKTVNLPEDIFGVEINVGLMHQAYVRQMANARQGSHKAKTRGEVNRTTAKWYRQKGTGRARHGSRKAPIFVGGGVAHGPKTEKRYTKEMPRQMRRQALRCALSVLVRDDQLIVVEDINITEPKTKIMRDILNKLVGDASAIVLLGQRNENVERATYNLAKAMTLNAMYLNVRDLLSHDKVIMPLEALNVIINWLGKGQSAPVEQ
jgi:large subunit ribosomal protein L4